MEAFTKQHGLPVLAVPGDHIGATSGDGHHASIAGLRPHLDSTSSA